MLEERKLKVEINCKHLFHHNSFHSTLRRKFQLTVSRIVEREILLHFVKYSDERLLIILRALLFKIFQT